jgi:poly(3-hydroxybutyrate) depolymerase
MRALSLPLVCLLLVPACGGDSDDASSGTESGSEAEADASTEGSSTSDTSGTSGTSGDGDDSGTDATTGEVTTGDDTTDGAGGSGSSGCGQDPAAIATSLNVGGETREFELYLPPGYDADNPYPLIFAWHGRGGSGMLAQAYFGIQQQAGGDAIIVYPDGLPLQSMGGLTGWDLNPNGYDFDFFDALYQHITENTCVDVERVFSTGHSFGGYMSNSLGCYRGDIFNAIAPVAGGPPFWGGCDGAVAAWITHGTADDVVELSQGTMSRDTWAGANGCGSTTTPTDPSPCVAYEGCSRDTHWCEHPGMHEWPDFAAEAIWNFFSAQ